MKLTPELAKKYASYRERFLGGSHGQYIGFPKDQTDPCGGGAGRRYDANTYASFMVLSNNPLADEGTFLHVDVLEVEPGNTPDELESANITKISFGDNTVYASATLLSFVAEYAILGQAQSLEVALGIARSFQRLGMRQAGMGETGQGPYGFTLRSDSWDNGSVNENICSYGDGATETAHRLAPSFDQYASILSCCCLAKAILDDVPSDNHTSLRADLLSVIDERVKTIVEFIAFKTIYCIRWEAGSIQRPEEDRGPYCHHAAYSFARIAAQTVDRNPSNFDPYLGQVALGTVHDLTGVLIEKIADTMDVIRDGIRKYFVDYVRTSDDLSEVYEAIAKFFDVAAIVLRAFDAKVVTPVKDHIIDPIIKHLKNWDGTPGGGAINSFFAQTLHNLFVTGILLDTTDDLWAEDVTWEITLAKLFELIGTDPFPSTISLDINVDLDFLPPEPPWWDARLLGHWQAPHWGPYKLLKFDVPIGIISSITIPVPMSGLLRQLVAVAKGKAYLRFHAYNLLLASQTFDQVKGADPRKLAVKYDNAWFMALAHRFHNVSVTDLGRLPTILESAPDTFPKGKGANRWNQDFRWLRDIQDKDKDEIYSGLDFMAPLMIACSLPGDVGDNRAILLDALAPNVSQEQSMGPFNLPFQGPITNKLVFEMRASDTQREKSVYVAVVFDRTGGSGGKVTLIVPKSEGGTDEVQFEQDDHSSKLAVVPLEPPGIIIKEAQGKGVILISATP